jgi:hypothetical protein
MEDSHSAPYKKDLYLTTNEVLGDIKMNDIKAMVWLFPILFIFHDFEEIIFMQSWISKNRSYLSHRFPALSKKLFPHFDQITTSAFVLGVAEEFILISIVTVVSYVTNWYILWTGLFIAFILHLVIHCFQALVLRKYVPAIITSIICLPICVYMISQAVKLFPFNDVILYSVLSSVLMVANLILIHKAMTVFSIWLAQYERQTQ